MPLNPGYFRPKRTQRRQFVLLCLLAVGAISGETHPASGWQAPARAPVRFEGRAIPDPPRQQAPWTAPTTKLPPTLVIATANLFDAGMADPRGCEYRVVEVGDGPPLRTSGFVFADPATPTEQFVVGWDGVVYPALAVGDLADFDADILTLSATHRAAWLKPGAGTDRQFLKQTFVGLQIPWLPLDSTRSSKPASVERTSALKVCLLLRLGRVDLAETLFASGTTWTRDAPQPPPDNHKVNFQALANEWANRVCRRAVDAFLQSDDTVALAAARSLVTFVDRAEPRLSALGFPSVSPTMIRRGVPPHFPYLQQHQTLLADLERLAVEPPRGPIPGPDAPAELRVAALIRDLDHSGSRR